MEPLTRLVIHFGILEDEVCLDLRSSVKPFNFAASLTVFTTSIVMYKEIGTMFWKTMRQELRLVSTECG